MSLEDDAKELASIVAAKEILVDAEKRIRNRIQIALRRGSVKPFTTDDNGNEIELATISIYARKAVRVTIIDDSVVFPWAAELFGGEIAQLTLTEQARTSVTEYAKRRHIEAGKPDDYEELPGIRVSTPEPQPTLAFRPNRDIDFVGSIRDMWARCELPIPHLLSDAASFRGNDTPLPWESSWQEDDWQKP